MQENEKMCGELNGTFISCIFDNWEAMAVIMRFIKKWEIEQRLVRLLLLAKLVNGDKLAREILTVVSTELVVASSKFFLV